MGNREEGNTAFIFKHTFLTVIQVTLTLTMLRVHVTNENLITTLI